MGRDRACRLFRGAPQPWAACSRAVAHQMRHGTGHRFRDPVRGGCSPADSTGMGLFVIRDDRAKRADRLGALRRPADPSPVGRGEAEPASGALKPRKVVTTARRPCSDRASHDPPDGTVLPASRCPQAGAGGRGSARAVARRARNASRLPASTNRQRGWGAKASSP